MHDDEYSSEVGWFRRQTPIGLLFKTIGVFLIFGIIFTVIGLLSGWFSTGANIISPQHVSSEWDFAYTYDKSLTASALNWCSAKKAEDAETDPAIKVQRVSQTLAREANYNSIQARYNAELANAFKAKLVKPPDVPRQAPTLSEKVEQIGCLR